MSTEMWIEIFGYFGSLLVIVSMLMASVVKLRIINMIGNLISGAYALIIASFPLVLMNLCLVVINIYNLIKLFKPEKHYDLITGKTDDAFLHYFLKRYLDDIRKYFPSFDMKKLGDCSYIVCCNGEPAGVLLAQDMKNGELDIVLDYTTPTYRDCSVATYLYSKLPKEGVRKLQFKLDEPSTHVSYLDKMGFVHENGTYIKKLK